MQPSKTPLRFSNLRGHNTRQTPQSLPDDIGTSVLNVELQEGALGKRRPSLTAISLTSGPSGSIEQLLVHRAAAAAELWAISGGAGSFAAHRYVVGSGWTTVSFGDSPAAASLLHVSATTLNNKFFIAYVNASSGNTRANRLHVWDGSAVRPVGIVASAAATVANGGGAGAYAATLRYYRIGWRIKSGSVVHATAELSPAVSFTPDGASTNATVTKPTTPDSATHWVVYGNTVDTYDTYKELSEIAVGTTTYADTTAPGSYSGTAPPELGLNVPPPSVKYVIADGNRLIMAGVHESAAAAGETTPRADFVYVTRVLGTSTQGDDESIPNSATTSLHIPVGQNDGDVIVGLGGPIDGIIYVFKSRSIYRLIPTGIDTAPYVADRLTDANGALRPAGLHSTATHQSIVGAADEFGRPFLYFPGHAGISRLSPAGGIEFVGGDIQSATTGRGFTPVSGLFFRDRRQMWWVDVDTDTVHVYTPHLASRTERGWSGGWASYTFSGYTNTQCITMFEAEGSADLTTPLLFPVVGGTASGPASKAGYAGAALASDAGTAFTASVTSKPFLLGRSGLANVTCDSPILEGECESAATPTVALILDHALTTRTGTAPSLAASGSETRKAVKIEEVEATDAQVVQIKVTWDSDQTKTIDAVTVPYKVQENR